jgi:hypothetical protein
MTFSVSVNIEGGLGNQLFKIASAYSYSKDYNLKLEIEHILNNNNRPVYWDNILKNIKPYLVSNKQNNLLYWREEQPTKYSIIPSPSNINNLHLYNGIYLYGYLQSSKYFEKYKDDIKKLFKPDIQDLNIIKNKYNFLFENIENVIVVHARRTDYEKFASIHNPLSYDYYINAINIMIQKIKNPIFLFTSDDNSYWNELLIKYNNYNMYILNDNEINSFILLQNFQNYIISNSTYIWWCVYLSNNVKNVIAPSKWFGPDGPSYYNDIYENNWIKL